MSKPHYATVENAFDRILVLQNYDAFFCRLSLAVNAFLEGCQNGCDNADALDRTVH